MVKKCCVKNCASTRQDAVLHKFPSEGKRANKWLQCLRGNRDDQRSRMGLLVCHKHFEKKFTGKASKLLCGAYPTLFSPDEIISGQPTDSTGKENNICPMHVSHSVVSCPGYARPRVALAPTELCSKINTF